MLSFLRAPTPVRTNTASQTLIAYEDGRASVQFHSAESSYIMTHRFPPSTAEHGDSILKPPFHYHMYQTEKFLAKSGRGHYYLGLSKEPFVTLSVDEGGTKECVIPPGRYHRFENASATEDFVVDIHLVPELYEREQQFFRNFFGYLDDCRKSKQAPSLFQLMVFLHAADTPLAIPLPSERLGVLVSWVLMVVVAAWGRWVLGYQQSYPEYFEERKVK
ncbi:hypothetical protein PVAG01_00650 [Phlyctema vagabunda]|uniref:Cupin 2 conserved barrel domain-containing protein n=1 Tax=Phlyctema vagabunda TaxID=108571 RepID=A0ABR4PUZ1_9HELO